jgi:hypothetical protein
MWLDLGNSDRYEKTDGTIIYIARLNLVEMIAEI